MSKSEPVYVQLSHGRDNPDQDMEGWGFDGPLLGPFVCVHFTYMCDIRCIAENHDEIGLRIHQDMIVHDGKYYGDFEIIGGKGGAA